MLVFFKYFFGTFTANICKSSNEFKFAEMMLLVKKR